MSKLSNQGRIRLLTTASAAVAAVALSTAANAANTSVTPTVVIDKATTSVTAHDVIDAALNNDNAANITAEILNSVGQVVNKGTGTTTTFDVNNNKLLATAIGNNFENSIVPNTINNGAGDGAASLGLSINTGVIQSKVTTNTIEVNLANLGNPGISASKNSIVANATANNGTTTIAGAIPTGYASTTAGSSEVIYDALLSKWLNASGGLVASTVQVSASPTAEATATGNKIELNLKTTADATVVSAPALDDNTIAASVKGNDSDSTIDIKSGAPATFAGTAVVTNAQVNSADLTGSNTGSSIVATIAASAGTYTLNGGLSVQGNTVSSSASGNEALNGSNAGNRIVIADQVAVDGGAAGVSAPASVDTVYSTLSLKSTTNADLLIHNSQGNVGSAGDRVIVAASTTGSATGAAVEQVINGSINVSGNNTVSTALGNAASSAFETGKGVATFAASVALANQQTNTYANTTAAVTGSKISALINPTLNVNAPQFAGIDVNDNVLSATANGNSVSQNIDLAAVQVELPSTNVVLSGGTGPDGNVHADGSAIITNLQSVYSGDVTATEATDVHILTTYNDADKGGTINSKFTVDGNTQQGVAVGSNGDNSLSLTTTSVDETPTVGAGAGIASVQIADAGSKVTASSTSTAGIALAEMQLSKAVLTDNLQRAVAYGGLVGNSLDVDVLNLSTGATVDDLASTVTLAAGSLDATAGSQPAVDAAFGLLNVQSTAADVSATAGTTHSFAVTVGVASTIADLEQGSEITNENNALVAAAYGNNAMNDASLGVNVLDTADSDFGTVLNLTNAQTVTATSDIVARATGLETVYTYVADKVSTSQISTSNNTVQALAYANRAALDDPNQPDVHGNQVIVDATNIDTAATLAGTEGVASTTATVATASASFSLNNAQSAAGTVTASLLDLTPTFSASIFTDVGGASEVDDVVGSSVVSNGNTLAASGNGNRADNLLAITGNNLATTGALTSFQNSASTISALIGVAGVAGPNKGGVSIHIAPDNVTTSKIAVNGNITAGSVTGNSVTNALAVDGNGVTEGAVNAVATGTVSYGLSASADADYTVDSWQNVTASTLNSSVFGTFAIDMDNTGDVTTSSLKVDGNTQSSQAIANNGKNSLTLEATNLSAGSALVSYQAGAATVSASSDVDIFAPAGALNSTVSLSKNTNQVLAVQNNASNTTTVNVTNADSVGAGNTDAVVKTAPAGPNLVATADHVLTNAQMATTATGATAVTNIFNDDAAASLDSINASSVSVTKNVTTAEASANRSTNTMTLNAGTSLDASGAVVNGQYNAPGGAVTSSATTSASVTLAGALVPAAVNNGSVTLGENTTSSLARGNAASNVLNISAGADYGTVGAGAAASNLFSDPTVGSTSNAQALVLNSQTNYGTIAASSTSASYVVALNGTTGATLNGATVGVIGNSVSAAAYGNTSTSLLNVAPLNTGMPTAAIASAQYNNGPVSAMVTSVTYGITSGVGSITGSSTSVSGNTITATAIGNNAVNAITGN